MSSDADEPVTTWFLELLDRSELRPTTPQAATLEPVRPPDGTVNAAMYRIVGADWHWKDRLDWDDARWRQHVARPELGTWLLRHAGRSAGYAELEADGAQVQIAYFGLVRWALGRGWGGHFLTEVIRRAFDFGGDRVWVHTCSLDHPAALRNYQARGMRIYDEQVLPAA